MTSRSDAVELARDALAALGEGARDLCAGAARLMLFVVSVLRHGALPPAGPLAEQCWVLSRQCVLPVTLVVLPMGALISLQGASLIESFGVERLLAPLVALTAVRELAPGFAAMMVAMQAGTAVSAEVAVMRVREELDAYELMAVDPLRHVVAPRLWAGMLVAPLLSVLALLWAVMGAWAVAVGARGFASRAFLEGCLVTITPWDLAAMTIKSAVFGLVLCAVACFEGWYARGGALGVGRATNRAVVGAILGILMFNYVLNSLLYGAPAVFT
ncbi:MAG: ABC transporter permease [Deltaproteobacteria bacterium]|nr:ABC transporter permease [Deltaproteobacteria bacterium]